MKSSPLISVITVCYNEEKGIEKTCESIVNQSNKNFEWIVIDGKSTDGTLDIIGKYKKQIGYFVSEKDRGVYDAMNKGISKSSGKYLLFLNGGDSFVEKNILEKVSSFIKKDKLQSEIYYGNAIYGNGEVVDFSKAVLNKSFFLNKTISHQATFIKRQLFQKYGNYNPNYKIVADFDFWVKAIVKNKIKTKYLPIAVSIFNLEGIGSNYKLAKKQIEERNAVLQKYKLITPAEARIAKIKWFLLAILKKMEIYNIIRKGYRKVIKR